jgi:excinuclease ABC subunit B
MGIALHHERQVYRPSKVRGRPRKPTLDEMGPGTESAPYRPHLTGGRPGTRAWRGKRR